MGALRRQPPGLCIEYRLDDLPAGDLRKHWIWPVVYTDERFDFLSFAQRLCGQPNVFGPQLAAMHKAAKWAYEREWRIVDPTGDDVHGRELPMSKPSRIFLGSRMAPADWERIVEIGRTGSIPLFEMAAEPLGLGLRASPLATTSV
jgi:hypothetical protein